MGRLIDFLLSKDYFEDNVLIFLGDHGEYFNERPEFHSVDMPLDKLFPRPHGFDLHQEQIHVPLIIVTPDVFKKGIVSNQFVETRALFSTIMEITESGDVGGRTYQKSLLPIMLKGEKGKYCISEGNGNAKDDGRLNEPFNIEQKAIISPDGLKLIYNTLHKTDTLYDLNKDPGERLPLDSRKNKKRILELKRMLASRIDIDADFIKPEPYETILSMPQNRLISGINASNSDRDHSLIYLLDNDPQTFWQNNPEISQPISLTFVLKNPCKIKQLKIKSRQDVPQWFKNAHLLASNDGYNWKRLASLGVTNYSNEEKKWEFSVKKSYKYYKLNIRELADAQQNTISIAELQLIATDLNK